MSSAAHFSYSFLFMSNTFDKIAVHLIHMTDDHCINDLPSQRYNQPQEIPQNSRPWHSWQNLVRDVLPEKYKKIGALDLVDKIKSRGLLPDKYNKTSNLDVADKIKWRGLFPDKYKKICDLDINDLIVSGLVFKLRKYGIWGNVLKLIECFLYDGKQRVNIDGDFSRWKTVNAGVSQGSTLGPSFIPIIY